ncbi:hypothetical protein A3Q56_06605 [Intoshia linei]|uniref:G-protein coupled receptors family 1 profile domain-containing protein n=1 Tax=Intoshia linei TaxID=1819745 RepID=A0A177AVX6_9BILA|nr:hypothetical protein A3Q56_06605 [Intoshia linei]
MYFFQSWPFSASICVIVNYLQYQAMYLSIYTLCSMTLDKLLAIWNPIKWHRKVRIKLAFYMLGSIWFLSITFPIIWLFLYETKNIGKVVICSDNWGIYKYLRSYYFLFINLTGFILPSLYILVSTIYIIRQIKKKIIKNANFSQSIESHYETCKNKKKWPICANNRKKFKKKVTKFYYRNYNWQHVLVSNSLNCFVSSKARRKQCKPIQHEICSDSVALSTKVKNSLNKIYISIPDKRRKDFENNTIYLLMIIFILFFFTWLPTCIIWFWQSYLLDPYLHGKVFYYFRIYAHLSSYAYSCSNPIVYILFSTKYRKHFIRVCVCKCFSK